MEIGNIWTLIRIWLDLVGVWLLVRPNDFIGPYRIYGVPAANWERFFARLVGGILVWVQITRWDNHAKNTKAEPIMHWFYIVSAVGPVIFLGYHFVRLFTTKPDRGTQVEGPERRYLLPETEEEARTRYRAAWQKYRRLRVLFPLAFLGWLPWGAVLGTVFNLFHLRGKFWEVAWTVLLLAWIPFIGLFGWEWALWKCARCGFAFKGPVDSFFPNRWQYCDLPMWAESPDV